MACCAICYEVRYILCETVNPDPCGLKANPLLCGPVLIATGPHDAAMAKHTYMDGKLKHHKSAKTHPTHSAYFLLTVNKLLDKWGNLV